MDIQSRASMPTMKMTDILVRLKRRVDRIRSGELQSKEDLKAWILLGPPGWAKTEAPLSKIHPDFRCRVDIADILQDNLNMMAYNTEEHKLMLIAYPMLEALIKHAEAHPLEPHLAMLDELTLGETGVTKIMAGYIQNREIMGLRIPDNVIVIATGNQKKHHSGVGAGLAHLTNRFKVINIEPDIDGWLEWGATILHEDVLAYIHMKPSAAVCWCDNVNDETIAQQYRDAAGQWIPFPSARSWTTLSAELKTYPDCTVADFAGHVGPERASEFQAIRNVKIPTHADLLEGMAEWPENPMAKWVAAIRCGQLLTPGNARKTAKALKNLNPELTEVALKVGGKVAMAYLWSKFKLKVANGHMALIANDKGAYYYPGFSEELLAPGSRFLAMQEAR